MSRPMSAGLALAAAAAIAVPLAASPAADAAPAAKTSAAARVAAETPQHPVTMDNPFPAEQDLDAWVKMMPGITDQPTSVMMMPIPVCSAVTDPIYLAKWITAVLGGHLDDSIEWVTENAGLLDRIATGKVDPFTGMSQLGKALAQIPAYAGNVTLAHIPTTLQYVLQGCSYNGHHSP